jgi:K+-sensing histidine kinase KdpD
MANESNATEILVLYVDPFHYNRSEVTRKLYDAIGAIMPDRRVSVNVARSYLVEEAILKEAQSMHADVIILGKTQRPAWRRVLTHFLKADPKIERFLRERTDAVLVVIE